MSRRGSRQPTTLEQETGDMKKDIQNDEMNIQKIEQEKTNKLNKEKKHITDR